MKIGVGGVLALAVSALIFGRAEPSVASQGQNPPTFKLSAVRTDELIKLRSWGGYGGFPETITILYGDGRVIRTERGELLQASERYVEFDEIHSVVEKFVRSGVASLTPEMINQQKALRLASGTDFPTVELTVNLDSLNGSPDQIVFRCACSVGQWAKFSEMKEAAAISDLMRWIREQGATKK